MQKLVMEEILKQTGKREMTAADIISHLGHDPNMHVVILADDMRALKNDEVVDLDSANSIVVMPILAGG